MNRKYCPKWNDVRAVCYSDLKLGEIKLIVPGDQFHVSEVGKPILA